MINESSEEGSGFRQHNARSHTSIVTHPRLRKLELKVLIDSALSWSWRQVINYYQLMSRANDCAKKNSPQETFLKIDDPGLVCQ